jgi:predicted TIM-barrel fold metal-dependent hydrolase
VSLVQQVWNQDLPPVYDPYYEPFWSACEELGLVLSVHAGWGSPQGKFQEFTKQFGALVVGSDPAQDKLKQKSMMMEAMGQSEDSPLKLDMGPRRALWQLMLGGVFDRHPHLTFCLTEVRGDWLPPTLAALDALHATNDTPLTMKPSEYFARQCFITPSSIHKCEVEMRHEIGVDQMMFGTDYPHPEGTWPNTKDWIRVSFAGVPEAEARAILGENAIRAYGLDRATIAAVAERIGPEASEVFGEFDVPEARVAHWQSRAGYLRGPENTDNSIVAGLFAEDLAAVR